MKLHIVIAIITFLTFIESCKSQKIIDSNSKLKNFGMDSVAEFVWVPSKNDEINNSKYKDTAKSEINLVFEMQFNDSIQIFLNDNRIASKKIKTNGNLSAVEEVFSINYKGETKPVITIYSIEKKRKVSFQPREGYLFGYLNRLDTLWNIEYSNYQRMYY